MTTNPTAPPMHGNAASCDNGDVHEATSDSGWQVYLLGGVRLIDLDGQNVDPDRPSVRSFSAPWR